MPRRTSRRGVATPRSSPPPSVARPASSTRSRPTPGSSSSAPHRSTTRGCHTANARERDAPVPPGRYLNAYGRAKAAQEGVVRARRPDAVILRPRAVWGPGDRTLLPRVMARARRGVLPLPGGGHRPASMTYVDSLVEAVTRGGRAPRRRRPRQRRRRHARRAGRAARGAVRPPVPPDPDRVRSGAARGWRGRGSSSSAGAWPRCAREPPLTRYAVAALARPLTLDLTRLHEELGVWPDAALDVGLARTADWLRTADGAIAPA